MSGFEHLIVPGAHFRLMSGAEHIRSYSFNTGTAKHLFCGICGVKSYYVPRSNPDGFSINLRCVDPGTIEQVDYEDFDGRNWERQGAELAHLSHLP
jgi:hypothetical protein